MITTFVAKMMRSCVRRESQICPRKNLAAHSPKTVVPPRTTRPSAAVKPRHPEARADCSRPPCVSHNDFSIPIIEDCAGPRHVARGPNTRACLINHHCIPIIAPVQGTSDSFIPTIEHSFPNNEHLQGTRALSQVATAHLRLIQGQHQLISHKMTQTAQS